MAQKKNTYVIWTIIAVFVFQTIDVFFIKSDESIFGANIVARIGGIVISLVAAHYMNISLKRFCFKKYGWYFELLIGAGFSALSFAVVFLAEFAVLKLKGYENLFVTFMPPNFDYMDSGKQLIIAISAYIITLFVNVLFKEMFYRGFLISQLSDKYGFTKTNFIQSAVYTMALIPLIVHYYFSGRFAGYGAEIFIFFIFMNLLNDFISGIKWGYFYRVNGTAWMQIADHFVNNLLLTCVFFYPQRLPDKWYVIQMLAVQIVSCLIFIPFYRHRDYQNQLIAEEMNIRKEIVDMGIDNYSPDPLRRVAEINSDKKSADRMAAVIDQGDRSRLEEPISLSEIRLPNEETLAESIKALEINDSDIKNPEEPEALDETPSEKVREFFDKSVDISAKRETIKKTDISDEKNTDDKSSSNAESISRLVQSYFKKDFDKHTFS